MNNLPTLGRRGMGCGGNLVAVAITGFMALIFLGIGGAFGYTSWDLLQDGVRIEGEVVDLVEQIDHEDNSVSYLPVYRFRINGDTRVERGFAASNPPAFEIGERVDLLVDASDPSRLRANRFVDLWLLPTVFGGVGALLLVISMVTLLVSSFRSLWPF